MTAPSPFPSQRREPLGAHLQCGGPMYDTSPTVTASHLETGIRHTPGR